MNGGSTFSGGQADGKVGSRASSPEIFLAIGRGDARLRCVPTPARDRSRDKAPNGWPPSEQRGRQPTRLGAEQQGAPDSAPHLLAYPSTPAAGELLIAKNSAAAPAAEVTEAETEAATETSAIPLIATPSAGISHPVPFTGKLPAPKPSPVCRIATVGNFSSGPCLYTRLDQQEQVCLDQPEQLDSRKFGAVEQRDDVSSASLHDAHPFHTDSGVNVKERRTSTQSATNVMSRTSAVAGDVCVPSKPEAPLLGEDSRPSQRDAVAQKEAPTLFMQTETLSRGVSRSSSPRCRTDSHRWRWLTIVLPWSVAAVSLTLCSVALLLLMNRPTPVIRERMVVRPTPAAPTQMPMHFRHPAHDLIAGKELQTVVTDNLMRVGHHVFEASDRAIVSDMVSRSLAGMQKRARKRWPKAASTIDKLRLSDRQMRSIVDTLQLLSDPRVQSIGLDVAMAIAESSSTGPGARWHILDAIHRRLRARISELRLLRQQLLPTEVLEQTAMHNGVPATASWTLTLTSANIRAMEGLDDSWSDEIGRQAEPSGGTVPVWRSLSVDAAPEMAEVSNDLRYGKNSTDAEHEKLAAVTVGVLEEDNAILDLLSHGDQSREEEAKEGRVTGAYWATSDPEHTLALGSFHHPVLCGHAGQLSSRLRSAEQAVVCPLKFGAFGLDALRAAVEIRVLRR